MKNNWNKSKQSQELSPHSAKKNDTTINTTNAANKNHNASKIQKPANQERQALQLEKSFNNHPKSSASVITTQIKRQNNTL